MLEFILVLLSFCCIVGTLILSTGLPLLLFRTAPALLLEYYIGTCARQIILGDSYEFVLVVGLNTLYHIKSLVFYVFNQILALLAALVLLLRRIKHGAAHLLTFKVFIRVERVPKLILVSHPLSFELFCELSGVGVLFFGRFAVQIHLD